MTLEELKARIRIVAQAEYGTSLDDEVALVLDNVIKAELDKIIQDRLRSFIRAIIQEDDLIRQKIHDAIRNM